MTEIVESGSDPQALWRRIVNFPLIALMIMVGMFLLAAGLGDKVGSAIVLHSAAARMLARNGVILAVVLLTYKLGNTRLGVTPRDDLVAKQAWPNLGIGALVGFLLMALSAGIAAMAHVYIFMREGDSSQLAHALVTSAIMPAFMEEMLFRGILFRWIEEFGGSWAALIVTSTLFGLAHSQNPGATWFSSLAIAVEAGLLQARLTGPAILSGGDFGLEASIIALLVCTAAGIWFLWLAVRRGEVVQPWWVRRSEALA